VGVAFEHRGAHSAAIGVKTVPLSARSAVLGGRVNGGTVAARRVVPLISARAVAPRVRVAGDGGSIAAAIGLPGAGEVARGVRPVVPGCTTEAVIRCVVARRAHRTRRTRPLIAARTVAERVEPSHIRSVPAAVRHRCADPITARVSVVSHRTHATILRGVIVRAAAAAVVLLPFIPAVARTAGRCVATDRSGVVAAVGSVGAGLIAGWVAVEFVRTCCTI
jgi:hypothetical protein